MKLLISCVALTAAACSSGHPDDAAPQAGETRATGQAAQTPSNSTPQATGVSDLSAATSSLNGKVDDLRITVTPAATTIELPTDALFAFDSAAIEPGAAARLERTARIIAAAPAKAEIHVVGYTDAKGDDAYNLALSSRRADAVATWLQARPDLSGRQFTPVAKGEQDPVAPNTKADGSDNPEGRQRNRRVTVIVPR